MGMKILSSSIKELRKLEVVNLGCNLMKYNQGNLIGNKGMESLSVSLEFLVNIIVLDLGGIIFVFSR